MRAFFGSSEPMFVVTHVAPYDAVYLPFFTIYVLYFIVSVHYFVIFFFNLVLTNQTEWSTIPTCPRLMCLKKEK